MQRRSIYKQKAGALFMDTRPVYFGKIFFQKPKAEKAWAALSRNALAQRKDGYKRQKGGNRSIWNGFRLIFTSSL